VRLVIERDVLDLRGIRQREVLPTFLRRLAAQTGQLLNIAHASAEAAKLHLMDTGLGGWLMGIQTGRLAGPAVAIRTLPDLGRSRDRSRHRK
jgi:hypothetical protein